MSAQSFHRIATTLVVVTTGRAEHRAIDPKDLEAACGETVKQRVFRQTRHRRKPSILRCRRRSVGAGFPYGSASPGRAEAGSSSYA